MEENVEMRIPRACIVRECGYVVLDDENKKAYRVLNKPSYDIVTSEMFKEREGLFWPRIMEKNVSSDDGLIKSDEKFKTVEVEYLEHVVYWTEMSFFDIKQSLLFLCDISKYLAESNVHMVSHLWNISLSKGKPFLIDLGDFRRGSNLLAIYETIVSTLSEKTSHHIPEGYQPSKWMNNHDYILYELEKIRHGIGLEIKDVNILIDKTRDVVSKIDIKQKHIRWDTYPTQRDMPDTLEGLTAYAPRNRPNLCKVLESKKPETLLDLGCSYGLYSFYASSFGTKTVGLDYSHEMISSANKKADFLDTDCSFGFIDLLNVKEWGLNGVYESFGKRLKSEAVIAPALLHHVHGRGTSVEDIIREWMSCAEKWIMVEHIPNDTTGQIISADKIVETFKEGGFKNISVLDSKPLPRKWILAER